MPTYQLNMLGDDSVRSAPDPRERIACVGGCGRDRPRSEMHETPDGFMCRHCQHDLYLTCNDCGKEVRLNSWGESSQIRRCSDDVVRCNECFAVVYMTCSVCNHTHRRTENNVCVNPTGDEVCAGCWRDYWFICDSCGEVENRQEAHTGLNSQTVCPGCFDAAYVACGHCGRALIRGEHSGWEGDPFCSDCYGTAEVWKTQPWSGEGGMFGNVGSERRFGVELETSSCNNHHDLHGNTEWGCVYECSTPGKEFVSPILQGDAGFQEIHDFCQMATNNRWGTNSSCGLHIHLDISNDSTEECLRIAYAYRKTYTLWKKFVSHHRAENSMCGSPQYSCEDIRAHEHIEDFVECRDRFEFVNWRAYLRHGSFEVRLYHGSLNAREICNWVALHARFMDAVKGMSYDELDEKLGGNIRRHWPAMCELIGDTNLLDYWRRKASRLGNELSQQWDTEVEPVEEEEPVEIEDDSEQGVPEPEPELITASDAPTWGLPATTMPASDRMDMQQMTPGQWRRARTPRETAGRAVRDEVMRRAYGSPGRLIRMLHDEDCRCDRPDDDE